jgi:GT2 family glycosyltransferase
VSGLAIIIPCYQQWRHLDRCLDSVLWQLERSDRVIVVSEQEEKDSGRALAAEQGCRSSRVIFRHGECGQRWGVSKSRNEGVKAAEGCDWIKFLDADDVLAPFALDGFRKLAHVPSEIQVVSGGMYQVVDGRLNSQLLHSQWSQIEFFNPSLVSACFIRRSAFEAVGGFDEGIGFEEDWDLWLRLWKRNGRGFARVEWPVCYYWIDAAERAAKVRDHSVEYNGERMDVREYFRRHHRIDAQ